MLAVFGKHLCCYKSHFPEEERYDMELKDHSHQQCQRYKCRDIAVKRDVAHHSRRNTIRSEEAEGYGEQDKVGHQHTNDE